ncbi:MAG: TM2 domain-containing protein [Methylococcales bacterium]
MRGVIAKYDTESKSGVLVSGSGKFKFDISIWNSSRKPEEGMDVQFHQLNGKITTLAFLDMSKAVKSKKIAVLLGIFLGWAGVHRFYLGFYKLGIAQAILTVVTKGAGAVWGFTEGFLLVRDAIYKDAKGRPLKD